MPVTRRQQQAIKRRAVAAARSSVASGGCKSTTPGFNATMTTAQWAVYWSPRQVAIRQKAATAKARASAASAAGFASFAKSAGFTPSANTPHAPLWWTTYYATLNSACAAAKPAKPGSGIARSPAIQVRNTRSALRPVKAARPRGASKRPSKPKARRG